MKRNIKMIATIISIIILSTLVIVGCNGKEEETGTNQNGTTTEKNNDEKEKVEKSPFEKDCELYPYLKFSTNGEVVGREPNRITLPFAQTQDITTNKDTIAFDLRSKINSDRKPITKVVGKYMLIDYKDDYLYIAEEGKEIKDAFARITYSSLGFDKTQGSFLNSKGELFILYQKKLARIKATNDACIIKFNGSITLSENYRYIASQTKSNKYLLGDLETGESINLEIDENMMDSNKYGLNNYWVSNNGELLIAENIESRMVATGWDYRSLEQHDFYAFLTGIKIDNVYKAKFKGIPMYADNDHLIYSTQYELKSLSNKGEETIFKYIDFKEETYGYNLFVDMGDISQQRVSNKIVFTDGKNNNILDPKTLKWEKK